MADTILKYVADGYVATDYTDEYGAYEGESLKAGSFSITAEAYVDQGAGYVINDYVDVNYVGAVVFGEATLASEFSQSTQGVKVFGATAELNAFNTQLTAGTKVFGSAAVLASEVSLQAQASQTFSAEADLSAFNTTVYAGTRLRYADAELNLTSNMTSDGGRVRFGRNVYYTSDYIPYTGIYVNENDVTLSYYPGTDPTPELIFNSVLAFWARADGNGGTIISAVGSASNVHESAFRFALYPGQFRVSYFYSAGSTGGFTHNIPFSTLDVNITRWHHYWLKVRSGITGPGIRTFYTDLWIDGTYNSTTSFTDSSAELEISALDPASVGVYKRYDSSGTGSVIYEDRFEGIIAQLYLTDEASPASNFPTDIYDDGFVDLGTSGNKGGAIRQPVYYEPYDYGAVGDYFTNRSGGVDSNNLPDPIIDPGATLAEFTIAGIGGNVFGGEVDVTAQASLTAQARKTQQGSADLTATASVSAQSLRIQPGNVVALAEATVDLQAEITAYGQATLSGLAFTAIIATIEVQGDSAMSVETALSATAYDFTKAQSSMSSQATISGVATALIPTKGNVLTAGEFAVLADSDVIRGGQCLLATALSVSALSIRNRAASSNLLAFATTLSAGRTIEFQDANTLTVARETGKLLVDYETRLFRVEQENRINTTNRETRTITVESEIGSLLVDEER